MFAPRQTRAERVASRRARMALVACALWAFGVELGPTSHVAMHASLGAHTHDGAVVHAHGERVHAHGARRRDAREALDPSHGAHSLAHHHQALKVSSPVIARPPIAPVARIERTLEVVVAHRDARRLEPRSRGPPTV